MIVKLIKIAIFLVFLLGFNQPQILANSDSHKLPQKTVLLTGAAGFIGSNFLKYMFDKYPTYHFLVLDALTYAGCLDNIPHEIKSSHRFRIFLWFDYKSQACRSFDATGKFCSPFCCGISRYTQYL